MKTITRTLWLLLLCFSMACSDDDPKNTVENGVIDAVSNGTWRITYFYDSDVNKTSTYADYIFAFRSGDVVTATKGSTIQTGTWSIDDSNADVDTLGDLTFNITFTIPPEFELLSNGWKITEYTLTKINLTDVNDTGGNDYLTLEKN